MPTEQVPPHSHSTTDLPVGPGPGMIPSNDDLAVSIGSVKVPVLGTPAGAAGPVTVVGAGVVDGGIFATDRAGTPDPAVRAFRVRMFDLVAGELIPSVAGAITLAPGGQGSIVLVHGAGNTSDKTVLSAGPGIPRFNARFTNTAGVVTTVTVEPANDDSSNPAPTGTAASQGVLWQVGHGQTFTP